MRIVYQTLLLGQTAAILIAVAAAAIEIETIVGSGPLLSVTGLFISLASFRANRPLGLYFGLSAPTISLLCCTLIVFFTWGPAQAYSPILSLLIVYALISTPFGILAYRELNRGWTATHRSLLQFNLSTILKVILVSSLVMGALRASGPPAAAVVGLAVWMIFVGRLLWRFHHRVELNWPSTVQRD